VRHVDAIGKTDQSLIAITMTGRIPNAPSTSGLKVVHPTLSHSERHRGTPRNALVSCVSFAARRALLCVLVSDPELVPARNLHEMTSGLWHFVRLLWLLSAIRCTGTRLRRNGEPKSQNWARQAGRQNRYL
jgi:hypothetical protein